VSDFVVTERVSRVELRVGATLKLGWRLYKRLFARSVVLAVMVFGAVDLLDALARGGRTGTWLTLLTLILALAGVAVLQGGLVEIVRGLHVNGDDDASVLEVFRRAGGRAMKLLRISLLAGLGIGVGLLLFVVPGAVLATRWAVAVPVGMLEEGTARDALRRSREIVRGNGWRVWRTLFWTGLLQGLVTIPFSAAAFAAGPFGWWVAVTLASALTAPYTAHVLTIVYYGLVEPERPVALESGQRWQSIWAEADPLERPRPDSIWND
jgi:Membrane domain of glycerophosphoryl diester phosphodiesterase